MKTLLHIDSSGKGSQSVTKPLTAYFVKTWQAANQGGKIIDRDLSENNLSFVSPELIGAYYTPADQATEQQKQLLKQSDELIAELLAADEYVFGVPMYNFSVPAVFKAYIDLVVRVGKTFSYADGMPKGLLQNKKLTIITASGGDYSSPHMSKLDFLEPYLRGLFGFLGITDVTVVKAHGRDPAAIEKTSNEAKAQIDSQFATAVR